MLKNTLCVHHATQIERFLAGSITADERATLAEHLDVCSTCQSSLDQARWVSSRLDTVALPDIGRPDWLALEAAFDERDRGLRRWTRLAATWLRALSPLQFSTALASLAMAVGLVAVLLSGSPEAPPRAATVLPEMPTALRLVVRNAVVSVDGQRRRGVSALFVGQRIHVRQGNPTLTSPSGVEISLAAGATGELLQLDLDGLEWQLSGGVALFSVAKQRAGRAVWVRTDEMRLRVVGTVFSVQRGDEKTTVQVVEGLVQVHPIRRSAPVAVPAMRAITISMTGNVQLTTLTLPPLETEPQTPGQSQRVRPRKRDRLSPLQRRTRVKQILNQLRVLDLRLIALRDQHRQNGALLRSVAMTLGRLDGKDRARHGRAFDQLTDDQARIAQQIRRTVDEISALKLELNRLRDGATD